MLSGSCYKLLIIVKLNKLNIIKPLKNKNMKKIEFKKPNQLVKFKEYAIDFIYTMMVLFMVIAFVSIIEKL